MPRQDDVRTLLSDPGLRSALESMIRRRVPPSEVDDIVQSTFTEALASQTAPEDPEALRRWIFGVARNKVVDFHRRGKREAPAGDELPEQEANDVPHSDRDLLKWAERELPPGKDAPKTLEWMLREGAGEKLEAIAKSERLPAPTVRQRVHRLRSYMKKKWAAELALVAALTVVALVFWLWPRKKPEPVAAPHILSPREMAQELRQHAIDLCDKGDYATCIPMLDRAAATDPEGDKGARVLAAREAAKPRPAPPPQDRPAPSVREDPKKSAPPATATATAVPDKPTLDKKMKSPSK